MYQFATVMGILIANLLGKPLGTPGFGWRVLLGLAVLPSVIQLAAAGWLVPAPAPFLPLPPSPLFSPHHLCLYDAMCDVM
jgi:hypothetical protein